MTRITLLALALVATAPLPLAAQSDAAVRKGIHDREVQWRTAVSIGNWSAVESFMAKDFMITMADGKRLDRAEYLKEMKEGTMTFAPVPSPEYKVLVYAGTAVHLGEANQLATGDDGTSTSTHVVWTDTWVRTATGQWLCLASQYGAVPAK